MPKEVLGSVCVCGGGVSAYKHECAYAIKLIVTCDAVPFSAVAHVRVLLPSAWK